MFFERFEEVGGHVLPLVLHLNVPSLVVDSCTNDVDVFSGKLGAFGVPTFFDAEVFDGAGDLGMSADDSVAEADGGDVGEFIACPGEHRHRV